MAKLTKDQYEARRHGMGATDIIEVMGLSPYADAGQWHVYNQKVGLSQYDAAVSPERAWGHVQEEVIFEWYRANVQPDSIRSNGPVTSLRRPTTVFASPDGLTDAPGPGLEIKNVGAWMAADWSEWVRDGVPQHVIAQCQIGMFVTGRRTWDVCAAIGGTPPKVWHLEYHEDLATRLVTSGANWYDRHILGSAKIEPNPPPIDGTDACKAYLQSKYPRDVRDMIPSTPAAELLIAERARVAQRLRVAVASRDEIEAKLMRLVGDARGVKGELGQFTWKMDRSGRRAKRFTPFDEPEE